MSSAAGASAAGSGAGTGLGQSPRDRRREEPVALLSLTHGQREALQNLLAVLLGAQSAVAADTADDDDDGNKVCEAAWDVVGAEGSVHAAASGNIKDGNCAGTDPSGGLDDGQLPELPQPLLSLPFKDMIPTGDYRPFIPEDVQPIGPSDSDADSELPQRLLPFKDLHGAGERWPFIPEDVQLPELPPTVKNVTHWGQAVVGFGKYHGMRYHECYSKHADYTRWIKRNNQKLVNEAALDYLKYIITRDCVDIIATCPKVSDE